MITLVENPNIPTHDDVQRAVNTIAGELDAGRLDPDSITLHETNDAGPRGPASQFLPILVGPLRGPGLFGALIRAAIPRR